MNVAPWCIAPPGGYNKAAQASARDVGHLDISLYKHFVLPCLNICENTSLHVFDSAPGISKNEIYEIEITVSHVS